MLNRAAYEAVVTSLLGPNLVADLGNALLPLWMQDTIATHGPTDFTIVHLREHGSSQDYLFDITRQRAVAAFGIPIYVADQRDASREAGYPMRSTRERVGAGRTKPYFVKGHLIAHSLGGGMDINFVPQLRRTNGGQFRVLENQAKALAQAGVQAFYFVYCIYPRDANPRNIDVPKQLQQYLVEPSGTIRNTADFENIQRA